MDSSSSPLLKRMPSTPEVARPIGRSVSSVAWNRIDWPSAETSSRSSSAPQSTAPTSSSPSRRLMPIRPPDAVGVEVGQPRLLDQAGLGGEHQVRRDVVVADLDDLGDLLVRLERQQVGHVLAARVAVGLGQLVGLGPVDPALVGEEQDPVVRRADEEVRDDVVLLERRALHALAAALLGPVQVGLGPLRVTRPGDRDDDVLDGDEVLHGDVAVVGQDPGAPVVAVLVDDLGQLVADDGPLPLRRWPGSSCRSAISISISASSSTIFCRSRAASRRSCISRMALAWISSTSSSSIRPPGVLDGRRPADQRDDLVQLVERLDAGRAGCGRAPRPCAAGTGCAGR